MSSNRTRTDRCHWHRINCSNSNNSSSNNSAMDDLQRPEGRSGNMRNPSMLRLHRLTSTRSPIIVLIRLAAPLSAVLPLL
jgi:hypothetical protein